MKSKREWKYLIQLAQVEGLDEDQIKFLLALREVEGGEKGNEFRIKDVAGAGLKEQALVAIGSIKKNEVRWHDYIRSQSHISFVKFFGMFGGPQRRGWRTRGHVCWVRNMEKTIKGVENELKSNPRVGTED